MKLNRLGKTNQMKLKQNELKVNEMNNNNNNNKKEVK